MRLWVLLLVGCAAGGERVPRLDEAMPDQFWVRLLPGVDPSALAGWDAEPALVDLGDPALAAQLGLDRSFRVHTDRTRAERLARHPDVAWVHPEAVAHTTAVPNDPLRSLQWSFDVVRADEAWRVGLGRGQRVAVLDTGVESLTDGLGELRSAECWDFIDFDDDCADPRGHGTHVSGTINQATHNGLGVAGLAPLAAIVPVRVIDAFDVGPERAIAQGVIWSADRGVQVANLSLGGVGAMPTVEDALTYAYARGTVVVASAGNNAWDDAILYPARYPTTIAVAATDLLDRRTDYSNASPDVDIAAPGGDTSVDLDGNGWVDGVIQETVRGPEAWEGTSMAAPHVAAAAALVMEQGLVHPDDVRAALEGSAVDLGAPGWDPEYGHGRLDIAAALAWTRDALTPLAIRRSQTRAVAPGAVRVRWEASRPCEAWVEDSRGRELGRSPVVAERHSVELYGPIGASGEVDLVVALPGGDVVREAVELTF